MTVDSLDTFELEQDDLRIEKHPQPAEDGDVTHVVFSLTLADDREGPADVRLVDPIPTAVPDGKVGLHPDHRDDWVPKERRLVFERTFDPGEELTTLYGINTTDDSVVESFLGAPDVSVDPVEPTVEGDGGSLRGVSADAVVEAVESADESQRAALREALGSADAESGSVEARLRHLQTEVADLTAYREALAEFIDENGSAREVIERLEDDIDQIRSDLDAFEQTVVTATDRIDEVDDRVGEVDGAVDALREDLDEMQADLSAGREWRRAVADAAALAPSTSETSGRESTAPDPVDADAADEAAASDGEDPFTPADPSADPFDDDAAEPDDAAESNDDPFDGDDAPETNDDDDPFANLDDE